MRNWFYWKLVEQHTIRKAEAIFFTCAEEMRLANETFSPYQPKRQINVRYGVSKPPEYHKGMGSAFAHKCPGVRGRPYFLFLGRIHPKKGVDLLIKAYSTLGRTGGTSVLSPVPTLVIAGPDLESAYGQEMQKLASETCPKNSVHWPGMLAGDAKWGALYNSEAFVLTSHQENFGIAVAEALACGKPVLISKQINIWREIAEDKAGLVGDDTIQGAESIFQRWKALSPEEKAAMKDAAKSCYEDRFDIASSSKYLMAVIADLTVHLRAGRGS